MFHNTLLQNATLWKVYMFMLLSIHFTFVVFLSADHPTGS